MSIPLFVSERPKPELTTRPLSVGCLIFERMDQIDFTGPFEVLSHMPDTTVQIIGKELSPIRDVQGAFRLQSISSGVAPQTAHSGNTSPLAETVRQLHLCNYQWKYSAASGPAIGLPLSAARLGNALGNAPFVHILSVRFLYPR